MSTSETDRLWKDDQYQLLDFGSGRKLERFGGRLLDRPCPAAEGAPPLSTCGWQAVDVRWPEVVAPDVAEPWPVDFALADPSPPVRLRFQVKLTPAGHVGLFPEQAANWRWLYQQVHRHPRPAPRSLNLFAYTGGASLALAAAGAEVVHIDASAPAVRWARHNAASSGLAQGGIRWIVEDAFKFLRRELRRQHRYELIVLDPPAYGHGPDGRAWRLTQRWRELLDGCLALLPKHSPGVLLWTGHSPQPTPDELCQRLAAEGRWTCHSDRMQLIDACGRPLDAGYYVRAVSNA